MNKKRLHTAIALATVTLMLSLTGQAHHATTVYYSTDQTVEITGVVKQYRLINPHLRMQVEVTNQSGETELWTLEGGVAGDLRRRGWEQTSVSVGETVRIVGNPAKNPNAKAMHVESIIKGDGTVLE